MSQQAALAAIYEQINPAITGVGVVFKTAFGGTPTTRGRIFQEQASQDTALPLAVFAVNSEETTAFLNTTAASVHEMSLDVTMWFRPQDGVETAMASEEMLYTLLHMVSLSTADPAIASIKSVCTARGTAEVLDHAISVSSSFTVHLSRTS